MVDEVLLVYSIISSPMRINPVLVVETLAFSNVENLSPVPLLTCIGSVDDLLYSAVSFVGLISGRMPEILTKLSSKFIPWFTWLTLICKPSVIDSIPFEGIVTSPPLLLFNSLSVLLLSKKRIVPAAPVINSPWTLPMTNWEVSPIPVNVNLAFVPTLNPIGSEDDGEGDAALIVTTSPTW